MKARVFSEKATETNDFIVIDFSDLAAPSGIPIYGACEGRIVQTGYEPSAGNYIIIQYTNGLFTN